MLKDSYAKTKIFLLLISLLLSVSCSEKPQVETSTDLFAMDTYITLTAYGGESAKALVAAEDKIYELERMWSVTDSQSEIYAVNHGNGSQINVSDETADIISFALEMADKTSGALDLTIYPVLTAWGFTTETYQIPKEEDLSLLLQNVGYDKILLEDNQITLPKEMQIDLGAVGKGYATDVVADVLKEHGVISALIDLGGNILTIGSKPDGSKWRIGIKNPIESGNIATLEIADLSIVTSGGYEKYFIGSDGQHYGHIINPENGKPAQSGLSSVSIISADSKVCDALSTALFVMGFDEAISYWRESKDFEMILITEDGEIHITEGLADNFTLSENHRFKKVNVINI